MSKATPEDKITFQRGVMGALANVLLNFLLIPIYGIVGAAIATLIAQIIANYAYDFSDRRLHSQMLMKTQAIFLPWQSFR